jgi:phosphoserine phosphatase RsbU/P
MIGTSVAAAASSLPATLQGLLDDYRAGEGREVRLWVERQGEWVESYPGEGGEAPPDTAIRVPHPDGADWRLEVKCPEGPNPGATRFLAEQLGRLLRHESEARFFAGELAERYEEITLLYSINEILGSVISVEEASDTILTEVVSVLGARRAALWVHDPQSDELYRAASVGEHPTHERISVSDTEALTARVFRDGRPVVFEESDEAPRADPSPRHQARRESCLSVPVSYTPPEGEARTVGVINLVGRRSGESFYASDLKLLSAIASQIGAAVETGRLVAESLSRERFEREMELAHDLQLKLLPSVLQFDGFAEVGARCVPADSVGGDFYHLFRLPEGRLGAMVGDVSSHGFSAALIMALTMSAVAIHASEGHDPAEVLRRVHRALISELEVTEMYLTLFYGVIDPQRGEISYSNAGHPYAFRISADGEALRLGSTQTPLGIADLEVYQNATAPWTIGEDLLFLFTDGLSDSLHDGETGEDKLLRTVAAHRREAPRDIVESIFRLPAGADLPSDDRTALIVRK